MNNKQFDNAETDEERDAWLRSHPWVPEKKPDGWYFYNKRDKKLMGPYGSEDIADKEIENILYPEDRSEAAIEAGQRRVLESFDGFSLARKDEDGKILYCAIGPWGSPTYWTENREHREKMPLDWALANQKDYPDAYLFTDPPSTPGVYLARKERHSTFYEIQESDDGKLSARLSKYHHNESTVKRMDQPVPVENLHTTETAWVPIPEDL